MDSPEVLCVLVKCFAWLTSYSNSGATLKQYVKSPLITFIGLLLWSQLIDLVICLKAPASVCTHGMSMGACMSSTQFTELP